MAEETAVAETSPTFDTAQLDAILNQIKPMPADPVPSGAETVVETEPDTSTTEPSKTVAEPAKSSETAVSVKEPSPFDPPPSVLGETQTETASVADPVDSEYGTMPEEAPPQFKSKEAKAEYAKMRVSHEKLKTDLRKFREEQKKTPVIPAEAAAQIAELTQRVAQLNEIVERKAIEDHPWVKENFDDKKNFLINSAKKDLEKIEMDPKLIDQVLSLSGKARVEAMDELYNAIESPYTKDAIVKAVKEIDVLNAQRDQFIADRKGNNERLTQAEKAAQFRAISEQENRMKDSVKSTIDLVTNKFGFEFLKKANEPGSEKWNERVDNDLNLIEELAIRNTDPQKLLTAITLGVQAPHYRMAWQNERTNRLKAEQRVAELEGTLPSTNGSRSVPEVVAGGTGDPLLDAAGVKPEDSLAEMARKLGRHMESGG